MLKTLTFISLLVFAANAFACWKVEGDLSVDGETWRINQKFDHGKTYSFPMGSFILDLSLSPQKEEMARLKFTLHEKKGINRKLVTKGEELLTVGKLKEVYARGEAGQPHSIISIKITNI